MVVIIFVIVDVYLLYIVIVDVYPVVYCYC